jgi:hypothetical protein
MTSATHPGDRDEEQVEHAALQVRKAGEKVLAYFQTLGLSEQATEFARELGTAALNFVLDRVEQGR